MDLWEVQGPSSTRCGALGRECDHQLTSTWSTVWLPGPRFCPALCGCTALGAWQGTTLT